MRKLWVRFFSLVGILFALPAVAYSAAPPLQIRVLSTRPDMVTGGQALVRIDVPATVALNSVRATLNGSDVTGELHAEEAAHRLTGLITGLVDGRNAFTAGGGPGENSTLTLINHPITGPVFAGPKEEPFVCETGGFNLRSGGTLGPPIDESCSVQTRVDYYYRSTTGGSLKSLPDPQARPADLAHTTISSGATVPFIVRIETGTIDRGVYQTAMLHDPAHEPAPDFTTRPAGWNGRLIYMFGGGCVNGWYRQGSVTGGVENDFLLGQGYALASSSLNVFGNNCDDLLSSETMMMVKEHFIDAHGPPLFTMGLGCSGGAEQMYPIAQNYPGLLDGFIAGCSFPDIVSGIPPAFSDARLLNHYFKTDANGYKDQQRLAISGLVSLASMIQVDEISSGRINATEFCPNMLNPALRYNAQTNPKGARCDIYDHAANSYGRDPATGFAFRPLDNVGVQYGLKALNDGVISKEEFFDLNQKIGGFDQDGNLSPQRSVAAVQGLRAAYKTGRVLNGAGGLATTPVIDYRVYEDDVPGGNPHLRYYSFAIRARMQKANGYHDNQIMLTEDRSGGRELFSTGSPVLRSAIASMDLWLSHLSTDMSGDAQIVKLRRAKPVDLVDACWSHDEPAPKIVEEQVYGSGECEQLYPSASFPRGIAGSPIAGDTLKCRLKPIDPADYEPRFTPAESERLKRIFPDGVCDWSKPGIEQQRFAEVWQTFVPALAFPHTDSAPHP